MHTFYHIVGYKLMNDVNELRALQLHAREDASTRDIPRQDTLMSIAVNILCRNKYIEINVKNILCRQALVACLRNSSSRIKCCTICNWNLSCNVPCSTAGYMLALQDGLSNTTLRGHFPHDERIMNRLNIELLNL